MKKLIIVLLLISAKVFSQTLVGVQNIETGSYKLTYSDTVTAYQYSSTPIRFQVPINTVFANVKDSSTAAQDSYTQYLDWCVLLLPTNYTPTGQKCKLVMLAHGAGGSVTSTASQVETMNLVATLRSNGYAVFDCNGGSDLVNLGGSFAVQSYLKAYDYIINNYNVDPNLYVSGYSMGGLSALNVALNSRIPIKAIALLMPVTSLYNQAWSDPWNAAVKGKMQIAYNFATDSIYEVDKTYGYDPYEHWASDTATRVAFPPIKIWHGNSDVSVNYSYSKNLVSYINKGGGEAYMRIVNGGTHNNIWDASYVNTEILHFLNRK